MAKEATKTTNTNTSTAREAVAKTREATQQQTTVAPKQAASPVVTQPIGENHASIPRMPKPLDVNALNPKELSMIVNSNTTDTSAEPVVINQKDPSKMTLEEIHASRRNDVLTLEEHQALDEAEKALDETGEKKIGKTGNDDPDKDLKVKNKDKIFEEKDIIDYMFKEWFIAALDWTANKAIIDPVTRMGVSLWDSFENAMRDNENTLNAKNKTQTNTAMFAIKMNSYVLKQEAKLVEKTAASPDTMKKTLELLMNEADPAKLKEEIKKLKPKLDDAMIGNLIAATQADIAEIKSIPEEQKDTDANKAKKDFSQRQIRNVIEKAYRAQKLNDMYDMLKKGAPIPEEMLSKTATENLVKTHKMLSILEARGTIPSTMATPEEIDVMTQKFAAAQASGAYNKEAVMKTMIAESLSADVNFKRGYLHTTAAIMIAEYEAGSIDYEDMASFSDPKKVETMFAVKGDVVADKMLEHAKELANQGKMSEGLSEFSAQAQQGYKATQEYSEHKKGSKKGIKDSLETIGMEYNIKEDVKASKQFNISLDADGKPVGVANMPTGTGINVDRAKKRLKQQKLKHKLEQNSSLVKDHLQTGKGM